MARKASKKSGKRLEKEPVTAKVVLTYSGEPVYSNYAEVASSMHEFQVMFAVTPTKPSVEQIEQVQDGTIKLEALIHILMPPTIIPGLIRALMTTKEQHEALFGPIKDIGGARV